MTPADIIKLAAEYGLAIDPTTPLSDALEMAFKLGAIIEREACAKICEETYVEPGDLQVESCHEAAKLIRARGQA